MNIYIVERTDSVDYDEYDSFVVVVETEKEALNTSPSSYTASGSWPVTIRDLKVTLLGRFIGDVRGVILASFNAG